MYIPDRAGRRLNAMLCDELHFCFGKDAPAPPNYAAAAEQTAAGNKEMLDAQTIANRPDQFTPFGSTTWQQNGDQWQQYTNLNPESQRALDAQLKLSADKSELAGGMYGRLEQDFKDPMDFSQLPAWGDVPQAGDLRASELRTQAGVDPNTLQAGNLQTQAGVDPIDLQAQQIQAQAGVDPTQLNAEQLQRNVDFSGAEQRTGAQQARQNAEDAIYGRSASRLDPQWEQRTSNAEAQLAAQGLRPGDKAYDQAMENLGRERTDAYQQATYGSIMGGGQEAERTVGMQRAGREQDMGEALRSGDFANTAAGQAFNMAQGAGGQNFQQDLAAQGQAFQQARDVASQNFGQQAQAGQQMFGQNMTAQQQAFLQAQAAGAQNFGQQATAGQQNFAQQLASQGQAFGQEAQAGSQNFGQQAQAGQQNFGQQTSQSQQQNQMRNAQMAEEMTKRGFSLNEINAIISGQQVNMPNAPDFSQAGYTSGPDYSGAAKNQYQGQQDQFSADQAMWNSLMSGVGQGAVMMSDRRLKFNIMRIGVFKRYPLYLFQYIWGKWAVGVMADEINQDAVIVMPNGYAAVDYGKIK